MRRSNLVAVFLAALAPFMAAAQGFDGLYVMREGYERAVCPDGIADNLMTITGARLQFWESACTLTNPVSVRDLDGAILFDASCSGEGVDFRIRTMLMPSRDGGIVRVGPGFAVTYDRCQ